MTLIPGWDRDTEHVAGTGSTEWGWLWARQLPVLCQEALPKGGTVPGPVLLSQPAAPVGPALLSWALPSVLPLDLQWVLGMILGMSGVSPGSGAGS